MKSKPVNNFIRDQTKILCNSLRKISHTYVVTGGAIDNGLSAGCPESCNKLEFLGNERDFSSKTMKKCKL